MMVDATFRAKLAVVTEGMFENWRISEKESWIRPV